MRRRRKDSRILKKYFLQLVFVLIALMSVIWILSYGVKAAAGYKTGHITLRIHDDFYGVSTAVIKVSDDETFSSSAARTYAVEISSSNGGPHSITLGSTSVTTKKDSTGKYNIFNISVKYYQQPYTILKSATTTKVNGYTGRFNFNTYNAENTGSSTLTTSISDVKVSRTIKLQIHAVHLGVRTDDDGNRDYGSADIYYERPQYAVDFEDGNGGTYGKQSVRRGMNAIEPDIDPVKTGYHFNGWQTLGPIYNNQTIPAIWEAKTGTYMYHANGGTGEPMGDTVLEYGSAGTLSKNTYKRKGYLFLGWGMVPSAGCKEIKYLDEDTLMYNEDSSRTIDLYAVWQKENTNFNMNNIIEDKDMFTGSTKLEGGAGTIYDKNHTSSEYAHRDSEEYPGYFTEK